MQINTLIAKWKSFNNNNTSENDIKTNKAVNIRINNELIHQYILDIKNIYIQKYVYDLFKQNNLDIFLPFLSFPIIMKIYSKFTHNNEQSQIFINMNVNIENQIIYIIEDLLNSNNEDIKHYIDIINCIISELNKEFKINIYDLKSHINNIQYMFQYLNTLMPCDVFENIIILDSSSIKLNRDVIKLLRKFSAIFNKNSLYFNNNSINYILDVNNINKDINIQFKIPKILIDNIDINQIYNTKFYYIFNNIEKLHYHIEKDETVNNKEVFNDNEINMYFYTYKLPLNNILYVNSYININRLLLFKKMNNYLLNITHKLLNINIDFIKNMYLQSYILNNNNNNKIITKDFHCDDLLVFINNTKNINEYMSILFTIFINIY